MTRSSIGGALDLTALTRLHFNTLSLEERTAAIRRMAAEGHTANGIASATGLSVEAIAVVLGPQ
jgi:hypothetical protein